MHLSPLWISGILWIAFAYRRRIRLEEGNLGRIFGGDHEAYRRASRALVPWPL